MQWSRRQCYHPTIHTPLRPHLDPLQPAPGRRIFTWQYRYVAQRLRARLRRSRPQHGKQSRRYAARYWAAQHRRLRCQGPAAASGSGCGTRARLATAFGGSRKLSLAASHRLNAGKVGKGPAAPRPRSRSEASSLLPTPSPPPTVPSPAALRCVVSCNLSPKLSAFPASLQSLCGWVGGCARARCPALRCFCVRYCSATPPRPFPERAAARTRARAPMRAHRRAGARRGTERVRGADVTWPRQVFPERVAEQLKDGKSMIAEAHE